MLSGEGQDLLTINTWRCSDATTALQKLV